MALGVIEDLATGHAALAPASAGLVEFVAEPFEIYFQNGRDLPRNAHVVVVLLSRLVNQVEGLRDEIYGTLREGPRENRLRLGLLSLEGRV